MRDKTNWLWQVYPSDTWGRSFITLTVEYDESLWYVQIALPSAAEMEQYGGEGWDIIAYIVERMTHQMVAALAPDVVI